MKSTVFFIIALSIFSSAMAHQDQASLFAELSATEFGRNMVNFVKLNQNVGVEIDNIKSYLGQFKSNAQEQLKTLTTTFDDKISGIEKEISDSATAIDQLTNKVKTQSDRIEAATTEITRLTSSISTLTTTIKNKNNKITSGDSTDTAKKAQYAKDTKDIEEAIAACVEAITLMGQLKATSSQAAFVQVTAQVNQIRQIFLSHKLSSHSSTFGPILEALAELSTHADPAAVANILSLIEQLKKALEAELVQKKSDEAARIEAWKNERADLVSARDSAQTQKTADETSLNQEKLTKETATTLKKQFATALQSEKDDKEAAENKLKKTQTRKTKSLNELTGEIALIDELIAHFNKKSSKLDTASTYVKNIKSKKAAKQTMELAY